MKKISARNNSNTLVTPPTAENKIGYSTHCFPFPRFEKCAIKQFGVRGTFARALDVLATKPLSYDTAALVQDSCAIQLITDVICRRDSVISRASPRTEFQCTRLDPHTPRVMRASWYSRRFISKDCVSRHACNITRCAQA